jgi:hypothetical protein
LRGAPCGRICTAVVSAVSLVLGLRSMWTCSPPSSTKLSPAGVGVTRAARLVAGGHRSGPYATMKREHFRGSLSPSDPRIPGTGSSQPDHSTNAA